MALPVPTISVQDGVGAAANVAANATAFVTPGNSVTFALQSTTGVLQAQFIIRQPGGSLDGLSSAVLTGNGPFSWTIQLGPTQGAPFTLFTEVTDGNNPTFNLNAIVPAVQYTFGLTHRARGVVVANASLTAFTVGTGTDGITYVQGDVVLLAGQTTASQNGLYVVGVVATTAPLTRVPDMATGLVLPKTDMPQMVELGPEGTVWGNETWKLVTTGPVTIGTTTINFLPRKSTLVTGAGSGSVAVTASSMWIGATGTPSASITYKTPGGTITTQVPTLTAGYGTGSVSLAIGSSDTSTYLVTVQNF
jgi:hypothetical protein